MNNVLRGLAIRIGIKGRKGEREREWLLMLVSLRILVLLSLIHL